jgi:hypothetical protein
LRTSTHWKNRQIFCHGLHWDIVPHILNDSQRMVVAPRRLFKVVILWIVFLVLTLRSVLIDGYSNFILDDGFDDWFGWTQKFGLFVRFIFGDCMIEVLDEVDRKVTVLVERRHESTVLARIV